MPRLEAPGARRIALVLMVAGASCGAPTEATEPSQSTPSQLSPLGPRDQAVLISPSPHRVRAVYLVPSDRTVQYTYVAAIRRALIHAQRWYRDQLADGKTFSLAEEPVTVVHSALPASDFAQNRGAAADLWRSFYDNVAAEGLAQVGGSFDDANTLWVFFVDADAACGQWETTGDAGVVVGSANGLRGFAGQSPKRVCDRDQPSGPNPCGWTGALAHEMGHAAGLRHPTACEAADADCPANSLMWLGFRAYPQTSLSAAERRVLEKSRFFTPSESSEPIGPCACEQAAVHVGDLLISSAAMAQQSSCVGRVEGNLTISPGADLIAVWLPALTEVTGAVTVDYTVEASTESVPYRVVELPSLARVGGRLSLTAHVASEFIEFDLGFPSLTTAQGPIEIAVSGPNFHLQGLPAMTEHFGALSLTARTDLRGAALLPKLTRLAGSLTLRNDNGFRELFASLLSIGGDLSIVFPQPASEARFEEVGFKRLKEVRGKVELLNTPWRFSYGEFERLESIGGSLIARGTAMTSLARFAPGASIAHLEVERNAAMLELGAEHYAVSSQGSISIVDNPLLPTCNATGFVSRQTAKGWHGQLVVAGNDDSAHCTNP